MQQHDDLPAVVADRSRRHAVKTIVGGVTAMAAYNLLPARWGVPVIESVLLPAHAVTSALTINDPCAVEILTGDQSTAEVEVRVNGYVTPPTGNLGVVVHVTPVGAGTPVTVTTATADDGSFVATEMISGGPGITRVEVTTTVTGAVGSASCRVDVDEPLVTGEVRNHFFSASGRFRTIRYSLVVQADGPPPYPSLTIYLEVYNQTSDVMAREREVAVIISTSGYFSTSSESLARSLNTGDQLTYRINMSRSTIPPGFTIVNFPETITVPFF